LLLSCAKAYYYCCAQTYYYRAQKRIITVFRRYIHYCCALECIITNVGKNVLLLLSAEIYYYCRAQKRIITVVRRNILLLLCAEVYYYCYLQKRYESCFYYRHSLSRFIRTKQLLNRNVFVVSNKNII
jgi:hypothetical protein